MANGLINEMVVRKGNEAVLRLGMNLNNLLLLPGSKKYFVVVVLSFLQLY